MTITTKKGLWVSSTFTEKFGSANITPAKTVPGFKTLERSTYDKEIKAELGAQECTLEDVVAFLENPPQGADDGYANIFYVAGFVVSVYWGADDRAWCVDDWSLDDDRWSAGRRVFSRAFASHKEITLMGGQKAKVSVEDYNFLVENEWTLGSGGYAVRGITVDGKKSKELMHRVVIERVSGEIPDGMQVDHIDKDRLNNTRKNLRLATNSQNQANGTSVGSKTGFRGVRPSESGKRWKAVITVNQDVLHLGYFDSPEAAALAYNEKASELFGEYATLNVMPSNFGTRALSEPSDTMLLPFAGREEFEELKERVLKLENVMKHVRDAIGMV